MCVTFVVFTACERCTRPISTKPGIYGSGRVWANALDAFRRALSRGGRGRWADVGFVVCFRWGAIFSSFFFVFFSSNAHDLLQVRANLASCTSLLVLIARAVRGRFPQTRYLWKRASMDQRVGRGLSRGGRGRWADVGFVVCFPWGGIFSCFP